MWCASPTDRAIDPLGRSGERHPVPCLAGPDPQRDRKVRFSRPRGDGDRLQQLRSVLPTEVRVTAETHPLFGRLLAASGFKRLRGTLYLVVTLPDKSVGTIATDATDVFGDSVRETNATVLSAGGFRHLHDLAGALRQNRIHGKGRK